MSPMDKAKANRWSELAAQEIASRCLYWHEHGATLDVQRAAAIIRAAHAMQFGGEWEYCKPCDASEFWTGEEWKPIGMAYPRGAFQRQTISQRHRRRVNHA